MMPPPVGIPGFAKIAVWHDRTHRDLGHRWFRSQLFDRIGSEMLGCLTGACTSIGLRTRSC